MDHNFMSKRFSGNFLFHSILNRDFRKFGSNGKRTCFEQYMQSNFSEIRSLWSYFGNCTAAKSCWNNFYWCWLGCFWIFSFHSSLNRAVTFKPPLSFPCQFSRSSWPSIKPGTWNIPEHPGTSNNYDNYEKKYVKLNFGLAHVTI